MTSFVAEPLLTAPAGGGFLLAHTADHRNTLFDFFAQTPLAKRPLAAIDFYPVMVNFGDVTQEFHIGLGAMATPGTIGGLFHVHQKLGRLPFAVVAEPAITYAKAGVEVTKFQSYVSQVLQPIISRSTVAAQFFPQGKSPQLGARLVQPELADALSYLVEVGAAGFYQGDIAVQLVKDCQEKGGFLTRSDLAQYRVVERQPLQLKYRGKTLLTNPPPSSGGSLIAFALAVLAQIEMPTFGTTEAVRLLADVMRLTNLARQDGYDANLYDPQIVDRFLADSHVNHYVNQLNKWGSTTHVSVVDEEGNAASATTSNGEGSSYVIPGTGIMMNNMLGEADLHPHGFHQWQENVRISSMMAPTIVLDQHRPEIVLGSGGSNRIRTAVLQVILNLVNHEMPVEAAVNSPRIHWEHNVMNIEPGFDRLVIDRTQFPFDQTVELWQQQNMFFGGVHAVTHRSGQFAGAGDPRRDGAVRIVK